MLTDGEKDVSTTNENDFRSFEQLKTLFRDQRWLITRLRLPNKTAEIDGTLLGW